MGKGRPSYRKIGGLLTKGRTEMMGRKKANVQQIVVSVLVRPTLQKIPENALESKTFNKIPCFFLFLTIFKYIWTSTLLRIPNFTV